MKQLCHIIYYAVLLLLAASCLREEGEFAPVASEDDLTVRDEAYWAARREAFARDYRQNLLRTYGVGYGYNGVGAYCEYDDVRDRIINLDAILQYDAQHGTETMHDDLAPQSYHKVFSGMDSYQMCEQFTANASANMDVLLFQGEVSASYSSTDMSSKEFTFCTIHDGISIASRHLEPYDLVAIARSNPEVLSQGFLHYQELAHKYILENNNTKAMRVIQEMLNTYGTHVIYHAQLGGKIKYDFTMNRDIVDSRHSASQQAEMSVLGMYGEGTGGSESDWYRRTQTDRHTTIRAYGGDSQIALEFINLQYSDDFKAKATLVNRWMKSVRFDENNPAVNNVELIDIKVLPVTDLILYPDVANLYGLMVGEIIKRETAVLPRVYNSIYMRIPLSAFSLASQTTTMNVWCQNEVVGELLNEHIQGKQYTVFYPTLNGKVQHEGIARLQPSGKLFTVTWDYTPLMDAGSSVTLTPLSGQEMLSSIYYNDGSADVTPTRSKHSPITYQSDYELREAQVCMWNNAFSTALKIGPYYLQQGILASTESNVMNSYKTLSKDIPYGYTTVSLSELRDILSYMYDPQSGYYTTLAPLPGFFAGKAFIFPEGNSYAVFRINKNRQLERQYRETIGYVLLKRQPGFKYL